MPRRLYLWALLLLGIGGYAVCSKEVQKFALREVETEGLERDFEFVVVYPLIFVQIEKRKLYHPPLVSLSLFFPCACAFHRRGEHTASLTSSRCSSVNEFKGFEEPAATWDCASRSRCARSRSCLSRSRRAASRVEDAPKVLAVLRSGSLPCSVLA